MNAINLSHAGGVAFETFKGKNGGWYWRCGPITGGRKTGDGSEGYTRRADARRAARTHVERVRNVVTIDGVRV